MKKTKMTLSKEELEFALGCAKSYYYDSSESDYPNKNDKNNEIRYRDLENALYIDNLEIEGYSRNEWTKFDPNDPKTFPQGDEKEVLLYVTCHNRENIEKFIIQATVNWISHNECYFSDFNGDEVHDNVDDITHWSPLPKPPIEEKTK